MQDRCGAGPRVLAYVGTYNEPVETAVCALLAQTRPPDAIVIVDNASTEHTSSMPPGVTVLRNAENLGPSGAISTGLRFAIEHGFDWMWIFDADSAPEADALEKLLALQEELDPVTRGQVGALSCSHRLHPSERLFHGRRLTPGGPRKPRIDQSRAWHECDAILWSGSLYRIAAVKEIGFPRCGRAGYWDDFGHDYGDMEFSYRLRRAGYRIFVHRGSLLHHHVGASRTVWLFGRRSLTTNHPAQRRFLFFRNMVYFWVYVFSGKNWPALAGWFAFRFTATVTQIVLSEPDKRRRVAACARGVWCGLRRELTSRG